MEESLQSKKMTKKQKAKVAAATALTGALLATGSLAYFTDRVETDASATAGTVDIALSSNWQDVANFNPGDIADLSYEISSVGNKSIDVREKFVITSDTVLTDAAQSEFEIYARADVTQDSNGAYLPNPGAEPISIGEDRIVGQNGKTITYVLDEYTLNGSGENAEVEDGISATEKESEFVLVFNKDAVNDYQGAEVSVNYLAEAKQHRNTGADTWAEIANESVSLGGETADAVPSRN